MGAQEFARSLAPAAAAFVQSAEKKVDKVYSVDQVGSSVRYYKHSEDDDDDC